MRESSERDTRWRWAVALLVGFALLRGSAWAFMIPPLNAPDEPSHLIAITQIRENRSLPIAFILDPGTVSENSTPRSPAVLEYLAGYKYTRFRALPYESTQPPLYYVVAAALTYPLSGDPQTLLYGARLVSALFGAAAIFFLALAARLFWRESLAPALGPPLALALLPQFGFQSATVTNDIAMVLAGSALCWGWAAAARDRRVLVWAPLLAGITALGVLSKLTFVVTIPGSLIVLLWRARGARPGWQRFVVEGALAGGVLLIGVGWWVLRNLRIYGEPTGARQMFSVIKGIYTTRLKLPPDTPIIPPDWGEFIRESFFSFWGVFGWRGVYLPPFAYVLAAGLSSLALGGAAWWLLRRLRSRRLPSGETTAPLLAYALTVAGAVASYLAYTLTTDASLQGRYVFVSLPALAFLASAGILYATPSARVNALLGRAALAGMAILQVTAWFFVGNW